MNSFISRIGGKKLLRKHIISRFPQPMPDKYIEVFGGAGWVLFGLDKPAKLEVFNDVDGELINLFRCVKFHAEELQRELQWVVNSRELFLDNKAQLSCRGFTDIQRAAQYYTLIKESYGSDIRTYGCSKRNIVSAIDYLTAVRERLKNTVIEHKDFASIIKVYDSPQSLFYLDPPYHGTEKYYESTFTDDDHQRLKDILNNIKGRFILSYNDDPFVRKLYQSFKIESVNRQNNLVMRHKNSEKMFCELLISNY